MLVYKTTKNNFKYCKICLRFVAVKNKQNSK